MTEQYLLGIDVGTTGTKSVVFDTRGAAVSKGYVEYGVSLPKSDWAEQDPKVWWDAVVVSVRKAVANLPANSHNLIGMGLSGQTNGIVAIDDRGNVLHPCIVWLDRRATPQAERVRKQLGEEQFHQITGVRIDPFYSIFKLLWFKEQKPREFQQTAVFLQPKDYVGYRLSGQQIIDVGSASSAGVLDVKRRKFATALLEKLDFPVEKLPKLTNPTEVIGEMTEKIANELGLPQGIPIVAGSGDVMVNAVGTGAVEPDLAYSKTATASDIVVCVDNPLLDHESRIVTYASAIENRWILVGGSSGGICYRWFRDNFADLELQLSRRLRKDPYELLDYEAEMAPPGSGNLIFLPYLAGARSPIWNPNARGVFFGIGLEHGKSDFIRSIMEGIAYSMRDRIEIIEKEIGVPIGEIRAVGGGARSKLWRQIISDVCNKTIVSLACDENECLGASILAGAGTHAFDSVHTGITEMIHPGEKNTPDSQLHEMYSGMFDTYRRLYDQLRQVYVEQVR
jgi:xylulokinase